MIRAACVLLLGLGAGLIAHDAWIATHMRAEPTDIDHLMDGMRETLRLDRTQFARFRELHENLQPQLDQLANEVRHLRAEFAAFEQQRRANGEIDFLAYAQLIEEQRAVGRECNESTQHLVRSALADMTPQQRELYQSLLAPAAAKAGYQQVN